MGVIKLFGVTAGDILASMATWGVLFAIATVAAGIVTIVWSRGRMRAAGSSSTLATAGMVVVLTIVAPLGGCGLGAKYGIERSLAHIVETGGQAIADRIVEGYDPEVRKKLGVASLDTVVELAPARAAIVAELGKLGVREHIADVLRSSYLATLDAASYTFLSSTVSWRDWRDRAAMMLSKPSSKVFDAVLGFFVHAAHATLLTTLALGFCLNGLAWLIVAIACRRRV